MIRTKLATRTGLLLVLLASLGAGCSSSASSVEAFCDVAQELHTVEELPSESLVSRYQELAPAEVELYVEHWAEQIDAWRDGGVAQMRLDAEYVRAEARYDSFLQDKCGMDLPREDRRQAAKQRWANLEEELEAERSS